MSTTSSKNIKEPKSESVVEQVDKSQPLAIDPQAFIVKNKKLLTAILGGVAIIVGGALAYYYYNQSQNEEAQKEMFQAVYYFEADSLNKALNGDGNNKGFLEIIDEYGRTKAGNLAKFYAGSIYLKQGKYQEAVDLLKDFSSSDILIQARAYALTGDAYMELDNKSDAIKYYRKAVEHKPNKYFTPRYMLKLALAQELNGELDDAIKTYDLLLEKYYDSSESNDAKKFKAKLEQMISAE